MPATYYSYNPRMLSNNLTSLSIMIGSFPWHCGAKCVKCNIPLRIEGPLRLEKMCSIHQLSTRSTGTVSVIITLRVIITDRVGEGSNKNGLEESFASMLLFYLARLPRVPFCKRNGREHSILVPARVTAKAVVLASRTLWLGRIMHFAGTMGI